MKYSSKFIIFCSSRLSKLNGQNIVSKKVLDIIATNNKLIRVSYADGFGFHIFGYFLKFIKIYLILLVKNPDFIYLVCSRSLLGFIRDVPILLISKFGYRVIVHVHGSDFKDIFLNKYISSLAKFLYKNCEIIIPSNHLRNDIQENFFKKIYLCENFIDQDLANYDNKLNLLSIKDEVFNVLWNSNIISSKGFFETCEAINFLNNKGYNIKFLALGEPLGDLELSRQNVIEKLNLYNKKIWFDRHNVVKRIQLKKILLNVNAVILPSSYPSECQPLSIIEGMIFSKHIIIKNTKALKNTIGNYPAELVERDKLLIANALKACINKDSSTITNRIEEGKNALKRFSYSFFESKINDIFFNN